VEKIPEPKPIRMLLPFPALDKDLKVNVKALAQLLKNDQKEDARKFAFMIAKTIDELSDLEQLYRPRSKGGLGWGPKPGKNPANDGLEKGLLNFAKIKNLANPENVDTAYLIAAMGELQLAKFPRKDGPGLKTKKTWLTEAEAIRQGALELANALPKDANRAQLAAAKINAACVSCHSTFKE
jgi:hypothetical protein